MWVRKVKKYCTISLAANSAKSEHIVCFKFYDPSMLYSYYSKVEVVSCC